MSGPIAGASYEFDATVGVTGSPNVSAWADQSGNGRDLAPYSGNVKTGTRTISGVNALSFGEGGVQSALWRNTVAIAQPYTLFAVVQSDEIPAGATQRHALNNGAGGLAAIGPLWMAFATAGISGGTVDTQPHLLSAVLNGASSSLWVDGVLTASGDPGGGTTSWIIIGTGDPTDWHGLVGHAFCFPSALSAANRVSEENFMMNKWGLYTRRPAIVAPGVASRYSGQ